MARLTNVERSLNDLVAHSKDAIEKVDAMTTWAEKQMEISRNTFDKPRQAQLAELFLHLSRMSQTVAKINHTAQEAKNGNYADFD
jgi:hypothetical protein